MKTLDNLTKDERSLLLFFETLAVDHCGVIDDPQKMSSEDFKIAQQWDKEGFCSFKRYTKRGFDDDDDYYKVLLLTHIIELSEEAWLLAHQERKARAIRIKIKKI